LGISDPRASIAALAVYVAAKHHVTIVQFSVENTNRDDFFSNAICWYETDF